MWLRRLFTRATLERDLDREMQFHLDAATSDHIRAGLSPDDARRRARMDFGGPEQMKEATRDARGTRWVEDFFHDCRFALRGMRRSPVFATAAILTIAIGVGANTAVWSITDALMRRALPVSQPETLHAVKEAGSDDDELLFSYPLYERIQASMGPSEVAGMTSIGRLYALVEDRPEAVLAQTVTGNFFNFLGVSAQAGRLLSPDDDRALGASPVVVITDRFWERRFGRDPSAVGRTMRLNGFPVTIVGVASRGFGGLTVGTAVDVFAPVMMQHAIRFRSNAVMENADGEQPWAPQNGISWLTLLARATPEAAARTRVAGVIDGPFRANRATTIANRDAAAREFAMRAHVGLLPIPLGFSSLREEYRDPLRALFGGVALVLALTCANLAGLVLARGEARSHEMAVRSSLGAMSGRLSRQLAAESLTLAFIGGAAGLAVAQWMIGALLLLASTGTRAIPLDATLNGRVLLFAFGITLVSGIVVGLAPVIRVRRFDLYEAFKSGGRTTTGHRLPLGRVLVTAQIALALILVTSAGVLVRTFQNFRNVETGFERESLVTARLDVRAAGYTREQLPAVNRRLLEAARSVPGVQSASLSLYGLGPGVRSISDYSVPGRVIPPGKTQGQENAVSPGYFRTVGISLLRGRDFTTADEFNTPAVAIVTEEFAKHFFGTTDVVGRRYGYGDGNNVGDQFEIVGVVSDVRQNGLRERPPRLVYLPLAQNPRAYIQSVDVRVSGAAAPVIPALRAAIQATDPNLSVREVLTVGSYVERALSRERLVARLAGSFGLLALILAAIGLYGVISYSVARRTNEMGVRLALGASPAGVSWLVMRDSLIVVASGLVVGIALWFPTLGLTRSMLFGVSPHDPGLLATSVGVLVVVGAIAGLLPALRAARIDPIEAIRAE